MGTLCRSRCFLRGYCLSKESRAGTDVDGKDNQGKPEKHVRVSLSGGDGNGLGNNDRGVNPQAGGVRNGKGVDRQSEYAAKEYVEDE